VVIRGEAAQQGIIPHCRIESSPCVREGDADL
jgi:hypothetical protein